MFCSNCGNQISDDSKFCPECGAVQGASTSTDQDGQYYYDNNYASGNFTNNNYGNAYNNNNYQNNYNEYGVPRKSRLVAGLLQIFLGGLGVGRFYLGYTGMGVAQLLTSFLCGAGVVWSFIDGILILCGQVKTDARGIPLKD